jgi:putative acetyltransferase
MPEYNIITSPAEYAAAAALFTEYANWLGIDLGFQHFEQELQALDKMYSAPQGAIILCKIENEYVACVGVRKLKDDIAELKRMYVKPGYRRKGIAGTLMEMSLKLAREAGYKKIVLDTLNTMTDAMNLYVSFGFAEIAPYYHNPNTTVVYFEREL